MPSSFERPHPKRSLKAIAEQTVRMLGAQPTDSSSVSRTTRSADAFPAAARAVLAQQRRTGASYPRVIVSGAGGTAHPPVQTHGHDGGVPSPSHGPVYVSSSASGGSAPPVSVSDAPIPRKPSSIRMVSAFMLVSLSVPMAVVAWFQSAHQMPWVRAALSRVPAVVMVSSASTSAVMSASATASCLPSSVAAANLSSAGVIDVPSALHAGMPLPKQSSPNVAAVRSPKGIEYGLKPTKETDDPAVTDAPGSAAVVQGAAPASDAAVGSGEDRLKEEMQKRVAKGGHTAEDNASQGGGGLTPSSVAPPSTAVEGAGVAAAQERPSVGALQAAISSVRGAVHECLEDTDSDEPCRIQVVFQSDGSVQSVSLSGSGAGTPAEACVRNAVKSAKVGPFSAPTYTAKFTVRP